MINLVIKCSQYENRQHYAYRVIEKDGKKDVEYLLDEYPSQFMTIYITQSMMRKKYSTSWIILDTKIIKPWCELLR